MRPPAPARRSSSASSACVPCTIVVRGPRQPVSARSWIGRTPCSASIPRSRAAARRHGCEARAPRAPHSGRSPAASPAGTRARNGAQRRRARLGTKLLDLREVGGRGLLAEPLDATATVGDLQEHDLDSRRPGGLDRGLAVGDPDIVEFTDGRSRPRASPERWRRSRAGPATGTARAIPASIRASARSPRPRSPA